MTVPEAMPETALTGIPAFTRSARAARRCCARSGAWQALQLERITPIETMHVEGDDRGVLNFSAYEIGERALAWIVEERALREALVPLVHAAGVTTHAPRTIASIGWNAAESGEVQFDDGGSVRARLIVGADGVRSRVREAAGIVGVQKPYGQTAVVANFSCERAHHGRAYQWFRDDGGVLAWLPLPGHRVSIVWSAPEALATNCLRSTRRRSRSASRTAGANALGAFDSLTPAAAFPLSFLKLPMVVAHRSRWSGTPRTASIRSPARASISGSVTSRRFPRFFGSAAPLGMPGRRVLLDRYARLRAGPVHAMQTITDALAHLFRINVPWVRSARNLGLVRCRADASRKAPAGAIGPSLAGC